MHSLEMRSAVIAMVRGGATNADAARHFGVPVGTVGTWLHRDRARRGEFPQRPTLTCPRCNAGPLDNSAYAYLLGLYLGDGCVSRLGRTYSLRIACADSWPGLIDQCSRAIAAVRPGNRVKGTQQKGYVAVGAYSNHWPCLFPQHGPGKKHDRLIVLEPWQQEIVDVRPWELIRGLIHSDGCRIINWTTRTVAGEKKRYEYPRYLFTNKSDDVRGIFTETLKKVGVEWTTLARGSDPFHVSVARRASVALMEEHVGAKY